ncbi:MAG TPA: hypothetical protein V6C85_01695 [Allocoleopsis sp.]
MILFDNHLQGKVKTQSFAPLLSYKHKRLEEKPRDNKDSESGKFISVITIIGLILMMSVNSLMLREDGKNSENAMNVSPEASYLNH